MKNKHRRLWRCLWLFAGQLLPVRHDGRACMSVGAAEIAAWLACPTSQLSGPTQLVRSVRAYSFLPPTVRKMAIPKKITRIHT